MAIGLMPSCDPVPNSWPTGHLGNAVALLEDAYMATSVKPDH